MDLKTPHQIVGSGKFGDTRHVYAKECLAIGSDRVWDDSNRGSTILGSTHDERNEKQK